MSSTKAGTETRPSTARPFYGAREINLVRGEGVWVWDDKQVRYLDATAMYGTASLGHAHPALADALATQARRLGVCFASFDNDVRTAYLDELAELTAPLDRAFLCNSGTEAIEGAFKIARFATGRKRIVATAGAFHGRTMGALSATFRSDHKRAFEPLIGEVDHVPFNDVEALEAAIDDSVAAFVLEPVQGEGGVHPASHEYLRAAERLCRERGALLILDEVQTGFARTGEWFAFRAAGIAPDLLCMAKGMAGGFPMGAIAIGSRCGDLSKISHGSTFGGNPLACAAARATLATMRALDLPAQVAARGGLFLERLSEFAGRSERIREVRGRGLLVGLELKERSAPIVRELQQRGILALAAGPQVLRFLPPLVIGENELDALATAVEEVLA